MAYNYKQRISLIGSKQTASSSASISFTSGISSNFSTYLVKLRNIVTATNNVSLLLTFSTDGGSTYLNTNYYWALGSVITTATNTGAASTTSITICNGLSSTYPMNGDIMIYGLAQGTLVPKCYAHTACYNQTPNPQIQISGGLNTGTTSVNAIKFAADSGNITSGTIALYGIQEGGFLY